MAAGARYIDVSGFIGRVANPPDGADDEVKQVHKMTDALKLQTGYPVHPLDSARQRQR